MRLRTTSSVYRPEGATLPSSLPHGAAAAVAWRAGCAAALALAGTLFAAPPRAAEPEPRELDCLIEPQVVVTLSAPVDGLIESVAVDRGDLVKQGQVLLQLESSIEKAAVESARYRAEMEGAIKTNQARLEYGSRKLTRAEELFKKSVLPPSDLDEAVAEKLIAERSLLESQENKRLAELDLGRSRAALELRTIRSPINGVVMERLVQPGEMSKQSPVLKLAQINPLRVETFVPVALLGKVTTGMQARVKPEQPVGGSFSARVTVVDRVVDAASGTFGVRLELANPGYKLPAGLKCTLVFPVR